MFKSIKNRITSFTKKSADNSGLLQVQNLIQNQLDKVIANVLKDRQASTENSNYSPADLQKITNQYMKINVGLATASSFVPGPAGMLLAVPTMLNSMGNQMKASYDIGCAHGKENVVGSEMLLNVMLNSRGIPTDSSSITDKVIGLSETAARKKMKSALTGMIPGLSTIFAIINAKKETMQVVNTASTTFGSSEELKTVSPNFQFSEDQLFEEKLKLLINLLTVDGKTADEEVSFITPVIQNSTLLLAKKEAYMDAIWQPFSDYKIDFDLIKKSGDGDEAMVDLVVLAKRDQVVVPGELEYIQYAAEQLNIDDKVYQRVLDETYH